MDPQELQANGMSANHLQDPGISHHRKERPLWMQGSVDDQHCYLRKLQEEEQELVNSLDRLQEILWQCTPFLDTQMPPDVQHPPSTYNIRKGKHEPMEDQHDTSPQGRSSRDRTNQNQERYIPG